MLTRSVSGLTVVEDLVLYIFALIDIETLRKLYCNIKSFNELLKNSIVLEYLRNTHRILTPSKIFPEYYKFYQIKYKGTNSIYSLETVRLISIESDDIESSYIREHFNSNITGMCDTYIRDYKQERILILLHAIKNKSFRIVDMICSLEPKDLNNIILGYKGQFVQNKPSSYRIPNIKGAIYAERYNELIQHILELQGDRRPWIRNFCEILVESIENYDEYIEIIKEYYNKSLITFPEYSSRIYRCLTAYFIKFDDIEHIQRMIADGFITLTVVQQLVIGYECLKSFKIWKFVNYVSVPPIIDSNNHVESIVYSYSELNLYENYIIKLYYGSAYEFIKGMHKMYPTISLSERVLKEVSVSKDTKTLKYIEKNNLLKLNM